MTQVILGSGGDIGKLLATELKQFTNQIRLVSRTPEQVNGDDKLQPADLLDESQVDIAVKGTDVAYLVVGLKYDIRVWRRDWPVIIRNVVNACLKHGTKLVFFDNVYMYDQKEIPRMTEESSLNPPSKKGEVRLQVVRSIQDAMQGQGLKAIIARSADFYGPGSKNGILNTLVLDPISKSKKPNWQASADKIHSFTYTPDAAKATALLGNTEDSYNQVWHLPTSAEKWTGRDFIRQAAAGTAVDPETQKPSYTLLRPWMIRLAGLFDPTIRELYEMQYQNEQDYFFDSTKFCEEFNFTPTTYEAGITASLSAGGVSDATINSAKPH